MPYNTNQFIYGSLYEDTLPGAILVAVYYDLALPGSTYLNNPIFIPWDEKKHGFHRITGILSENSVNENNYIDMKISGDDDLTHEGATFTIGRGVKAGTQVAVLKKECWGMF